MASTARGSKYSFASRSVLPFRLRDTGTEYDAVFWVDARLRKSLERDYIQIDRLLSGHAQSVTPDRLDMDRITTAVKTWFEGRGGRWLLVYDNADSLENEGDPYFVDLQRYLPDAAGVEIIITTRSHTATGMTELEAVEVGKLGPAEAVDMFMRCSKLRDAAGDVREEAASIVAELDYLALAVTLAGAYVAATPRIRSNITEYCRTRGPTRCHGEVGKMRIRKTSTVA
ncbi:hypothetical protein LTR12_015887 [Friedmanniomyces endolithicus]|nr:hypothetical protein LTR12_015887 [Friedmanniomyces endolithicus]